MISNVKGYKIVQDFGAHNSPNGTWYKAEADGSTYFLKKFLTPKYPVEGTNGFEEKEAECKEWLANRRAIIKSLNELGNGTGNIISPRDIFREKKSFFQATYWIDVQTDSLDQVKAYPYEKKLMLFKTYAAALKRIHSKEIIHGDLKPENVLIGKSSVGNPVAKFIDFDDSYFSKRALPPEYTIVTEPYQSPELAAYKLGHTEYRERLTCASDVFASGIILHQFWTGEMPEYKGRDSGRYLYEAISSGEDYKLDPSIPGWMQAMIRAMLSPLPEDRPTMDEIHIAVTEEKFTGGKEGGVEPPETAPVDFTLLDKVWTAIPKDLSAYTDESAAVLKKLIAMNSSVRSTGSQEDVNKYAKYLYAAAGKLKKKPAPPPPPKDDSVADYSTVDKILRVIPKDLSDYTEESVSQLRKVINFVNSHRGLTSQDDVDKMAGYLYKAYKGLKEDEGPSQEFSIKPASTLPAGYKKVKILSERRVCVYKADGSKLTLPVMSAKAMGFVVDK